MRHRKFVQNSRGVHSSKHEIATRKKKEGKVTNKAAKVRQSNNDIQNNRPSNFTY